MGMVGNNIRTHSPRVSRDLVSQNSRNINFLVFQETWYLTFGTWNLVPELLGLFLAISIHWDWLFRSIGIVYCSEYSEYSEYSDLMVGVMDRKAGHLLATWVF